MSLILIWAGGAILCLAIFAVVHGYADAREKTWFEDYEGIEFISVVWPLLPFILFLVILGLISTLLRKLGLWLGR